MAKGRNSLSWEEKFKWDVWYVDNWSLWLDVKLFAQSVVKLLSREGASPEDRVTMEEFLTTEKGPESLDEAGGVGSKQPTNGGG
jgi:hypothetical protein